MPARTRQSQFPGWGSDAAAAAPDDRQASGGLQTPAEPVTDAARCPQPEGDINELTELQAGNLSGALAEPGDEGLPAPDLRGKSVWVVDANSLIFQVFHAIPEMTSPAGRPVNAVYGFTRDILFLLENKKPDYLFVAFDPPGPTFRHGLDERYKAQRTECPVDLVPQFESIRQILEALRIPMPECEGYEADDALATIARQAEELGADCYLVSGDKDCRQLITDHIKVYNVRKNQLYDREALAADWGIQPEQVVDFQALVGDSVDNVPGVPGIGPKIAGELLRQFGTLDELLARAEEVSGTKRRENLLAGREQALTSRELVRLNTQVPCPVDWQAARVGGIDQGKLQKLFAEFRFHSFAQRFGGLDLREAPTEWKAEYRTVDTPEALAELVASLQKQTRISLDTETTSINPRSADLVGFSFAWEPGVAWYVPVRGPQGERRLNPMATLEALRPVLENPAIEKIGQNLKYDMIVLRSAGVELAGVRFDSMVASYLLDAGERNHNLDELAKRYLNHETIKINELIGTGKNQRAMDEVPIGQVAEYAGEDADVALRLEGVLAPKLRENQLEALFYDLEIPLVDVLAELEFNGIRVDVERLRQLSAVYEERLKRLEQEIYELAGRSFNIASPRQLAQVLFQEHRLPVLKKTKTGPSTDADVLEELARLHPLPCKITGYRQFAKLKNTYVDALPAMVNPRTGRVHTSFNQGVTATGRLSSSDPNLQNIPIRTDAGREIRSAFLPACDDWELLTADYSQIELRVLAHFSGDEALRAAFARDEDIHTLVASEVHGVPLDQVTADMRRTAKAVNFGVIYGQSPFGLAKQLGIEQSAAAEFIDAYFRRYPGVEEFIERVLADARRNGYVTTILGRRRSIAGVREPGSSGRGRSGAGAFRQRSLSERTAINTVIQGSAADLIKQAMLTIHRRLHREDSPARMLLQIHDELVFEVPRKDVAALAAIVEGEMTGVMCLEVPLKVDLKSGANWGACEPR